MLERLLSLVRVNQSIAAASSSQLVNQRFELWRAGEPVGVMWAKDPNEVHAALRACGIRPCDVLHEREVTVFGASRGPERVAVRSAA